MEIPNKKPYLDKNNLSIDCSVEVKEKKANSQIRQIKPKMNNTYGTLYNKKSYSLNKFKFK